MAGIDLQTKEIEIRCKKYICIFVYLVPDQIGGNPAQRLFCLKIRQRSNHFAKYRPVWRPISEKINAMATILPKPKGARRPFCPITKSNSCHFDGILNAVAVAIWPKKWKTLGIVAAIFEYNTTENVRNHREELLLDILRQNILKWATLPLDSIEYID